MSTFLQYCFLTHQTLTANVCLSEWDNIYWDSTSYVLPFVKVCFRPTIEKAVAYIKQNRLINYAFDIPKADTYCNKSDNTND